jgi:hypothetical protein
VRYAVLVESVRTPAGPRQRYVRHVSSIREKHLDAEAHRRYFWECADANLVDAGLSDEERAAAIATMEAVVPRPDAARLAEQQARLDKELKVVDRWLGRR